MVAMSGGVDSSVAAYLLKEEGYDITGAELKLWNRPPDENRETGNGSSSMSGAESVCRHLDVPYMLFDYCEEFRARVMDYFCREYLAARTPNPCVMCNRFIKFGILMDEAARMGMEIFATGHYARVENDPRFSCDTLAKGVDESKDQSYALFRMDRKRLGRVLFPLGSMTKKQTAEIAKTAGIPSMRQPESQDICFVPDGDYTGFILERFPDVGVSGPVLDRQGMRLGTHNGLIRYTIGQRKGIGIAAKRPYYVIELRRSDNALVVGFEEETYRDSFEIADTSWLVQPAKSPVRADVKVRYSAKESSCEIRLIPGDKALVRLKEPQKAITPGQAAVFYDGDTVLGGGWKV